MKIKLESIDLPEEVWTAFAQSRGWIEGNVSAVDFIIDKYGSPIWSDIASFNLQEVEAVANQQRQEIDSTLKVAQASALANAKEIVIVTLE